MIIIAKQKNINHIIQIENNFATNNLYVIVGFIMKIIGKDYS